MSKKILVIEDDTDMQELIRSTLEKETYSVTLAASASEGVQTAREMLPELTLLDLILPDEDGLEVIKNLKSDDALKDSPVIIISARDAEADVVSGLELGADDYITKPFSPRILLARLKAVLRRKNSVPPDEDQQINVQNLQIHPGRHDVKVDGNNISLTLSEFNILHLLARKPGWVFTRYQIVDSIRNEATSVTERSVDVLIVGLRRKLGDAGKLIETVRGIGYRFKEQEE